MGHPADSPEGNDRKKSKGKYKSRCRSFGFAQDDSCFILDGIWAEREFDPTSASLIPPLRSEMRGAPDDASPTHAAHGWGTRDLWWLPGEGEGEGLPAFAGGEVEVEFHGLFWHQRIVKGTSDV